MISNPLILKDNHLTPRDLLRACPFDHRRNLSKQLTEEYFFDHLFYRDAIYDTEVDNVVNTFWQNPSNPQILVMHGHSGTGKSTFIRYMRKQLADSGSEIDVKIVDFNSLPRIDYQQSNDILTNGAGSVISELIKRLNQDNENELNVDDTLLLAAVRERVLKGTPIANALRTILIDFDLDRTKDTLIFIKRNRIEFHGVLGTFFLGAIRDTSLGSDDDYLDLLNSLYYEDIFMLFFIRLYRKMSAEQKIVLCFDNLDILGTEYLTSEFVQTFENVLNTLSILSQKTNLFDGKSIRFRDQIRFLFVLRDANKTLVNQHIADSLGRGEVINFLKLHKSINVSEILLKRLSIIEKVCDPKALQQNDIALNEFLLIIKNYIDSKYFVSTIRPLFNFDLKKLVDVLYSLTVSPIPPGVNKNELGKDYGIIGRFVFSISKRLQDAKFFRDWYLDKKVDLQNGGIVEQRVLLTVLINLSGIGWDSSGTPYNVEKEVTLFDLLDELQGSIPDGSVFEFLTDAYLSHNTAWVGLISFKDKYISERSSFEEEERLLLAAREKCKTENTVNLSDSRLLEFTEPLKNVIIKVNPACFALIRYLVTHYEFLSAMFGATEPLFGLGVQKDENGKYLFEENIKRNLLVVTNQKNTMEVFCQRHYFQHIGLNQNSFTESIFCFKQGKNKSIRHHHSFRLITQHLDYVDRFRFNLINRLKKENVILGIEINQILITYIKQYVELLDSCIDPAGKSLAEVLSKKITEISLSEYRNFEIIIEA